MATPRLFRSYSPTTAEQDSRRAIGRRADGHRAPDLKLGAPHTASQDRPTSTNDWKVDLPRGLLHRLRRAATSAGKRSGRFTRTGRQVGATAHEPMGASAHGADMRLVDIAQPCTRAAALRLREHPEPRSGAPGQLVSQIVLPSPCAYAVCVLGPPF